MNPLTRTIYNNIHPASFLISIGAVMAGLTAAVLRGGMSLFPAILTILFAVLLQVSANLYHGYFDMIYSGGDNLVTDADGRDLRAHAAARIRLIRVVANGFGILAVTAGLPLFTFIGWIGIAYILVILIILFFYLAGPKALVRSQWGIIVTFVLFGPIAVSGTALIQECGDSNWFPIFVYSLVSGLMACNAYISIMCQFYNEDLCNGKRTLIVVKGYGFVRWLYLFNSAIVALILFVRPCVNDNVNSWLGVIMGTAVFVSSLVVVRFMKGDPAEMVRRIQVTTRIQYIGVMILFLVTTMIATDSFRFNILHLI